MLAILVITLGPAACAHDPTNDLVDARRAYAQASDGPANEHAPVDLYEAEKALQRAEQAHQDDPGSKRERDLAYVAMRRIQLAEAKANATKAAQAEQRAEATRTNLLRRQRDRSMERLGQVERKLGDRERLLQDREQALQEARLERDAFQRRLSAATASLAGQAKIEDDAQKGRTVVVLNSEVLFTKGSADLLDPAKDSLRKLARALEEHGGNPGIVIEGYTDSTGSSAFNRRLSQERANSVRQFLVQEGMAAGSISAIGFGEADPVASNATPEGRANNRRVEIVIEDRAQGDESALGRKGGG
ncbi:OmpA family protein [Paraliomyxa miuraensis]|uniref:OmpA family protein n=1 Tax=Paraliomyxa miuraensis TaxID=376150 RepID=UPI0022598717|nr:OmpA family protein [Paraliomyxa miuraensis]MCX4246636.1 OmpA family protein [Paraliomyxa miuraensis]